MRFALTDEQLMLRETVRELARGSFDDKLLAEAARDPDAAARTEAWLALRELGLVGLLVPDDAGGSGGCVTDACVVAEALGEAIAPVPYVATAIAAPSVLRAGANTELLAELASGRDLTVLLDRELQWPTREAVVAWDWIAGARGLAVVDGDVVEIGLDAVSVVDPPLDPLHRIAALPDPVTAAGTLTDPMRAALAVTRVGVAAFLLGVADGALAVAVDYANSREQYGRPIGSFQAIQHICADMLVAVETSRSIVYGASWSVEHAAIVEAERTAAAALAWVGDAAVRVCEDSIQVLGGIGVTQEHTAHLRLRSAHGFATAFGGVAAALAALGDGKLHAITGS